MIFMLSGNILFGIIGSIFTLGLLGAIRSNFTKTNIYWSCVVTVLNGCLSGGAAYIVSYGLDSILI